MVSSLNYQLGKNRLVTGFGVRRRTTCGRGVRKVVSNIARPALTYIANKIADVISGEGQKHRRVHRGASWKLTGSGRKPRRRLTTRRVGAGYRKRTSTARRTVAHRKLRKNLLGMVRKRRVQRRR